MASKNGSERLRNLAGEQQTKYFGDAFRFTSPPGRVPDTLGENAMKTVKTLLIAIGMSAQPLVAGTGSPGYEVTPEMTSGGAVGLQSEVGMEMRQEPPATAQVEPQIEGDVTWLCGGIGAQEAAYMKQQAKGYDLMLTFAARDGTYLADVDVDIQNAQGDSVLSTNCGAPIMLVDLPESGSYRIRADASGYTLNQTVRVDGSAGVRGEPQVAAIVMSWPQRVAELEGATQTSSGSSGSSGSTGDRHRGAAGSGAR